MNAVSRVDGNDCQSCLSIANRLRELQERDFDNSLASTAAPRRDSASQTDTPDDSENSQRDLLDREHKNDEEKQKLTSLVKLVFLTSI